MALAINDLDINQELDNNTLTNILGGRWVYRNYYRRYTRRYSYTSRIRRYYYATVRRWYTRTYTPALYQAGMGVT